MGADVIGIFSAGIWRIPFLSSLLGEAVCRPGKFNASARSDMTRVAGWGKRPTAEKARAFASENKLPYMALEDGFLRSYGTGDHFPPLSIVMDDCGIYYDSTCASAIENLLQSPDDLLAGIGEDVARAKALILDNRLSKYNHAPLLDPSCLRQGDRQRVLVIDQTAGDMSVPLGAASAETFAAMLAAARQENPDATIYVKTHPEVTAGHKGGYLTAVQEDERTVVLRQAINPLSLIEQMDRVYVVSSTMGFEALLAGKPVSVFGLPWYAGWGVTDDRQICARRTRHRSVDALFAAGYFRYARYLNPFTKQPGSIFDVIDWLLLQRRQQARVITASQRLICVGFRNWKAFNLRSRLFLHPQRPLFVRSVEDVMRLSVSANDKLLHWGRDAPPGLAELAQASGAKLVRMEDGFVRSVGLGSDMIAPLSLVLDEEGIYFDPSRPSGLERLLSSEEFTPALLARAQAVRAYIVAHGLTKYNLDSCEPAAWQSAGREVILVPGQVEDDASIRYGCHDVKTNLGLLQAARRAHPQAFIVYKPHPDVMSGNRAGAVALQEAAVWADHVEDRLSVVSCIDACDVVHTMTSLAGFDALLRHKRVVVYGQPFYAGWGLTEDMAAAEGALARRQRRLSLDELTAGVLLLYPMYWDEALRGYTTCEAVLQRLRELRDALTANGGLEKLRVGYARRQWRKLIMLLRSWRQPA